MRRADLRRRPSVSSTRPSRPGRAAARLVGLTCSALLAAVVGLVVWTLVPMAAGWQPTVVLTGSMAPQVRAGDVVLSSPVEAGDVQAGRVLWFTDPLGRGTLVHRAVAVGPDGLITTRGDANGADDVSPVAPEAVLGIPRLRIPAVGLLELWARAGRWDDVAIAGAALVLVTRGALLVLPQPRLRSAP